MRIQPWLGSMTTTGTFTMVLPLIDTLSLGIGIDVTAVYGDCGKYRK